MTAAQRAVVIDRREREVLEGQAAQACRGVFDRRFFRGDDSQQLSQLVMVHGPDCSRGMATRGMMRSAHFFRGEFWRAGMARGGSTGPGHNRPSPGSLSN